MRRRISPFLLHYNNHKDAKQHQISALHRQPSGMKWRVLRRRTTLQRLCRWIVIATRSWNQHVNLYATAALAPLHAHCRRFWYQFQHEGDLNRSVALHMEMISAVVAGEVTEVAQASEAILDYLDAFTRKALNLV